MKNNIKIFKPNEDGSLNNLFVEEGISAGFPSPAGDFEESRISLEKVNRSIERITNLKKKFNFYG